MNYAIFNADEGWIESPFFETEQEAIDFTVDATGMTWDELKSNDYYVQNFSDKERKEIEDRPDV